MLIYVVSTVHTSREACPSLSYSQGPIALTKHRALPHLALVSKHVLTLQLNTVRAGALPYWHPVRVRETDPTSWACVGELGGEQLPFISPFVPSLYPPLFAPWFRSAPNDLAPSPSCVPVSHACSLHSLVLCVCIGFWVDTNYRRIHFNACGRRGTPSLPPTSVHLVSRMPHSTLHTTPPFPPTFHRSL